MEYDVIIVGAGPAGLFAGWELRNTDLDVLIVDKGGEPLERESVTCGVGGAGTFSDGKLNLTSKIGGDPSTFNRTDEGISNWIDEVDEVFTKFGAEGEGEELHEDKIMEMKRLAKENGIEFIAGTQKHIGTDKVREVMDRFYKELKEKGIKFRLNTDVESIEKNGGGFVLKTDDGELNSKYIIAAPGRVGAYWLRDQADKLGVENKYGPIDVGIRVEFPNEIYEPIKEVMYDAKFRLYTDTYDDPVRTFCTNPGGFVSKEEYDGFVLVNGHANKDDKTSNTNFALLNRIRLTNPLEDTTQYGREIAKLANLLGGSKPIIQRLKDLRKGRRSTWDRIKRSDIEPTLEGVTPGDISMALPERVVTNLLEGLKKLDKIMPGVDSGGTLIYAPEIKFYDTKYEVNKWMETNLENFFVAGDASGHSRGIVFSGVTGMLAAKAVKKKCS